MAQKTSVIWNFKHYHFSGSRGGSRDFSQHFPSSLFVADAYKYQGKPSFKTTTYLCQNKLLPKLIFTQDSKRLE